MGYYSALLLSVASMFDPGASTGWAELGINPDRAGYSTKISIGTVPGQTDDEKYVYWLRLTEIRNGEERTRYTDTRVCDAANKVIAGMEKFSMPSGTAPHRNSRLPIITGGSRVTLRMPVLYGDSRGEISLSSNTDTPLAEFVMDSVEALDDCWSDDLPEAR